MKDFYKKGIATAGIVGVLSLVLLLGIASFALYSNYRTSGSSNASEPIRLDGSGQFNCRTDSQCIKRGDNGVVRGTCVKNACVYDNEEQNGGNLSDMGLKVSKSPLVVSWTGPTNPSATARYVVTIRKEDGTNVSGSREKVLDPTVKTVSFSTLTLPSGKYYAQLRYVPKDGQVLKQIKNFTIGN